MTQKKKKIGEMLIEAGLIDEYQLKAALNRQERWGKKLGETLIEMGFITEDGLLKTLSKSLNIPSIQIDKFEISKEVIGMLPRDLCAKHSLVPLAVKIINNKKRFVIAMSDPTNYAALDEVQFLTNMHVIPMVTSIGCVSRALDKYYPLYEPSNAEELSGVSVVSKVVKTGDKMEIIRQGREDVVDLAKEGKGPVNKEGLSEDGRLEGMEQVAVTDFSRALDDKLKNFEIDEDETKPKPFLQEEYEESTGVFKEDNVFNSLVKILKNKKLISDAELKQLLADEAKGGLKDFRSSGTFKLLVDMLYKKKLITDAEKKILDEG